ncbi:hypothetical protein D3C71_549050 [compost metagenome]
MAIAGGEISQRIDEVTEPGSNDFRCHFQPQHQAGIDDILARCTEMHLVRRLTGDRGSHLPDEFGNHNAVLCDAVAKPSHIGGKVGKPRDDRFRHILGDDAGLRFRLRQPRLETDHGVDIRSCRKQLDDFAIAEKA